MTQEHEVARAVAYLHANRGQWSDQQLSWQLKSSGVAAAIIAQAFDEVAAAEQNRVAPAFELPAGDTDGEVVAAMTVYLQHNRRVDRAALVAALVTGGGSQRLADLALAKVFGYSVAQPTQPPSGPMNAVAIAVFVAAGTMFVFDRGGLLLELISPPATDLSRALLVAITVIAELIYAAWAYRRGKLNVVRGILGSVVVTGALVAIALAGGDR